MSETSIKLPFVWTDSLRGSSNAATQVSQYSWGYERASVLYNLAALESHLACATVRETADDIQTACKHLCQAAGAVAGFAQSSFLSRRGDRFFPGRRLR